MGLTPRFGTPTERLPSPRGVNKGYVGRPPQGQRIVTPDGSLIIPEKRCHRRVPGVGTSLKELLESLGVDSAWCESCKQKRSLMNQWGIETCKKNIDDIAGWLEEAHQKAAYEAAKKLLGKNGGEPTQSQVKAQARQQALAVAWGAMTSLTWIDPTDPYRGLVRKAIAMAEAEAAQPKEEPAACS